MIPVSVEIGPDTISDSELVFELDFRSGENVGSLQKKTLPGTGTVTKSFNSRSSSMRETPYYTKPTKRMAMRQIENRQVNTHTGQSLVIHSVSQYSQSVNHASNLHEYFGSFFS
jgi:hypothetical protein